MSTSYDIRCIDCGATMGWLNETDGMHRTLVDMRNHASQFAVLADLIESIGTLGDYHELIIGINASRRLDVRDTFPFFRMHATHRLAVYDEYGRDVNDFGKYVACGSCDVRH